MRIEQLLDGSFTIESCPVIRIYRATSWKRSDPWMVYVTESERGRKIWFGSALSETVSHIGFYPMESKLTKRDVLRAANA